MYLKYQYTIDMILFGDIDVDAFTYIRIQPVY